MIVGALILAGGRSSRLGGSAKWELAVDGVSLLESTLAAVRSAGAAHVVVVGDERIDGAVTVRENPAYSGPVAAIAAGAAHLPADPIDLVFVVATDMPRLGVALPQLVAGANADGAIAVDRGVRQQLVLAVAPSALRRALDALPTVVDAPVRALLAELDLAEVAVPDGSTDDIDTWDDAARFGAVPRPQKETP